MIRLKRQRIRRWRDHCWDVSKGSTRVFHNAIRKYGQDCWRHDVLEVVDTLDDAKASEIRLIAERCTYFYDHPDHGYNMTRGGDCCSMSGELNHFFGKKHSDATRAIIREKRAQQRMNPRTDETKNKIKKGNIETFERLRKIGKTSERARNVWASRKANRPEATRPVLQIDDDDVVVQRHESINAALDAIGKERRLYNGSIKACCDQFSHRHAYGFKWRWDVCTEPVHKVESHND